MAIVGFVAMLVFGFYLFVVGVYTSWIHYALNDGEPHWTFVAAVVGAAIIVLAIKNAPFEIVVK